MQGTKPFPEPEVARQQLEERSAAAAAAPVEAPVIKHKPQPAPSFPPAPPLPTD